MATAPLELRRLLRPGEFDAASPPFPPSVPGCYYGTLDLDAETEPLPAAASAAPASLRALAGREVRPGLFVCDLLVDPPASPLPAARVVFLWRAAWRASPLEDDELLEAPLSALPAALGFQPRRIVALLCDRVRLERQALMGTFVARRLRSASAYASPLAAVPGLALRVLLAGAALAGLLVLLGIAVRRKRREARRAAERAAVKFGRAPIVASLLGLALLALAAAGLLAFGFATSGTALAAALRARLDPENFFAARLSAADVPAARALRINGTALREAGEAGEVAEAGQALFDASPSGTLSGSSSTRDAAEAGEVALRFASPAARRRFFLADLAAVPPGSAAAVAASEAALLFARVTPAGPEPAAVVLTLVPVVPGSCATTRPDIVDAAIQAMLSPSDLASLLATPPRAPPSLRLRCLPILGPGANASFIRFAGQDQARWWARVRDAGRDLERIRRQPTPDPRQVEEARDKFCSLNESLGRWYNLAAYDLPLADSHLAKRCLRFRPAPATADRNAPLVVDGIVRSARLVAAACPPASARFLASDGTMQPRPGDGRLFLIRVPTAPDTYAIYTPDAPPNTPYPQVQLEREPGGPDSAFRLRQPLDGTYLAPPLDCAQGERPAFIDTDAQPDTDNPAAALPAPATRLRTTWLLERAQG